MSTEEAKLPKKLIWAVVVLSGLPFVLNQSGVSFSSLALGMPRSEVIHSLLEWTAVCVAVFTAVFAFFHYLIERDVTTPVIGTALFFSGMLDVFHTLAADGLMGTLESPEQFIPLTWTISRTFNVCFLIAGTLPFLWKRRTSARTSRKRGPSFFLLVGVLFGVMAYAIIHICLVSDLPTAVYTDRIVPRPWDSLPLVLYLIAGGIVFPRFHRLQPTIFSHALIVSVIPYVAAQGHVAFGSTELYDDHFNIAHLLKIVGNLVPLTGLILDYVRAYRAESKLRATEAQLRVARDIQQGLYPQTAPQLPEFDLAGVSHPADVVGGDYFDYLSMPGKQWGIVVADVSGHELGAAILMVQTRAYLRALSRSQDDISQIVKALNRFLLEDVRNGMLVSLFLLRLDPAKHSFVFSAAGHEAHLLRASGEVETFESLSPVLGILDEGDIACGPETTLLPGDIMFLLTDGIFEAESPQHEQFGIKRALEVVAANREKAAREIVQAVFRAVGEFRGRASQVDDMTVVVLKRLADQPAP